MPRAKKKKEPPGPQGAEWVQSTAQSFDAAHHYLPAGALPSAEVVAAAVRHVAPAMVEGGGTSSSAGAAEATYAEARMGSLLLHRHSGEGLLATGFEPERHSVMVLGRPVQASPPAATSKGCDACFIFCVLVIHPMAAGLSVLAPHPVACHQCSCVPLRSTM